MVVARRASVQFSMTMTAQELRSISSLELETCRRIHFDNRNKKILRNGFHSVTPMIVRNLHLSSVARPTC
jgi:hypothetical protein